MGHDGSSYTHDGSSYTHDGSSYTHGGSSYTMAMPTTTAASLVTYKDASCWGHGYHALCSGYKLDSTGDSVHPEPSPADGVACFASCCDTAAHGAGGDATCWYGTVTFALCCEQVSGGVATTPAPPPASTTASAVSTTTTTTAAGTTTAPTTTAASL